MADRGFYVKSYNNDSILWFIIVFLLLFYKDNNTNGCCPYGYCPYTCTYKGQT